MLGKKIFQFDYRDMVLGMSTSDDLEDGGFSPLTDAVNLRAVPGVAYAPASPTDKSTNVVGEIIASSEDPQLLGEDRVFVDDEGNYYSWNGTTMTLDRTDATNPSGYVQGKTDMNAFDGSVFTTTSTTIVKWTVDSVFTDNFVTGLNSSVPHPLLTYENFQYIGDGNLLKRMSDASDSTLDTILTLPTLQNIVALGIDPGTGKILISTTQGLNISDTRTNTNKVLYYNGSSNKVDKVVQVDDMVTAFPYTEGQLYTAYGQNLGLWNGAGITFLRKFDITFNNERLFYKHHFTNIGPTLFLIENTKIIAHGPIRQGGDKVFYPAFKNQVNSNVFTHIANLGQNVLGMAFATDKFYTFDTTSVSTTNTQDFYTNDFDFERPYILYRVLILWKTAVSDNVDPGSIRFYTEEGVSTQGGSSGLFDLRNTSGASSTIKFIENINLKFKNIIQARVTTDTVNPGIKRIIGYGAPIELP